MNPPRLLVLLVSLPLLLGGCGSEKQVVNFDLIEEREGIRYLKDSDTPYTGNLIALHDKERKENDDRIEVDERRLNFSISVVFDHARRIETQSA